MDAFGFGLFYEDLLGKSDNRNLLGHVNYVGAVFSYKHKKFRFRYLVEDNWSTIDNTTTHRFGLTYQLF